MSVKSEIQPFAASVAAAATVEIPSPAAPSASDRLAVRPCPGYATHNERGVSNEEVNRPAGLDPKLDRAIRQSSEFRGLNAEQQGKFLELSASLMAHAEEFDRAQAQKDILILLSHKVNGQGAVSQRDSQGRTLLDNLHELSQRDPSTLAVNSIQKGQILISTVRDIIDADTRIIQGDAATCTITVAQCNLAKHNPAEYARLMYGLSAGQAQLLETASDGKNRLSEKMVLRLAADSLGEDFGEHQRFITSRMFQTSADNLVAGYDGGLFNDQVENLYEALYGMAFRRIDDVDAAVGALSRNGRLTGVNMVSLEWKSDGKDANHALEVTEVRGGRVYFRNPWGNGFDVPDELKGVVRIEDRARALYSMSEKDFKARLNYAMIHDAGATPGLTAGHDDPAARVGQRKTVFVGIHSQPERSMLRGKKDEPEKKANLPETKATKSAVKSTVNSPAEDALPKKAASGAVVMLRVDDDRPRAKKRHPEDDWS